jgi:hypothetical protein
MGGFLGSPWNFIFLEEFVAAGGARISLSSLCEETWEGHTHLPPSYLSWFFFFFLGGAGASRILDKYSSTELSQVEIMRHSQGVTT